MEISKQTRQLALLLLLTLAAYYLFQNNEQLTTQAPKTGASVEKPTSYVKGGQFINYDTEGNVSFELNSKRSLFFSESKRIVIELPVVSMHSPNTEQVTLTANEGVYLTDKDQLNLFGDVVLSKKPMSSASHQSEQITINTEALELNHQTRFISTDQAVTITKGQNSIKAIGLQAWIDQKKIQLLSEVRGRYVFSN